MRHKEKHRKSHEQDSRALPFFKVFEHNHYHCKPCKDKNPFDDFIIGRNNQYFFLALDFPFVLVLMWKDYFQVDEEFLRIRTQD